MDVMKLLAEQASVCGDKPALIFGREKFSFRDLKNFSFGAANFLEAGSRDKVVLFLPNIPETVFAFLGVFSSAAAVVPMDFMLTENEIIDFINHSRAGILVVHPKKDIDLGHIKDSCATLKKIIVCGQKKDGFLFWDELMAQACHSEPAAEIRQDALCTIFYTSGSTGHPKGVMLNYAHLDNPVKNLKHFLDVSADDVFLCGGVPFSHLGGLDYILFMLSLGATLILMPRFHPYEFLKNIAEHKVTVFCIVPAMFAAILSMKQYEKFDYASLRYAVVFGAPAAAQLLHRFHSACPAAKLLNGWGMTETSAPNAYSPPAPDRITSIGKFDFNTQAKIVDGHGDLIEGPGRGELLVKGEGIMAGYYREPALTEEVLDADGWLKTGDIARRDSEGFYYIAGRIKDMIKVAGEIVFSAEVEEKIYRHPEVEEVAVVGVFDKIRGEVPKAFIVTRNKQELDIAGLREFLKTNLAHFKIPHHFEFMETLPKNRTGKIDKARLTSMDTSLG